MHNMSLIFSTADVNFTNTSQTLESLVNAGKKDELNRFTRDALSAAAIAAGKDLTLLDAFVLGEPELLDTVAEDEVATLFLCAVAFGHTSAVHELLKRKPSAEVLAKAVYTAVECGRKEALEVLLGANAATNFRDKVRFCF